MRRFETRREIQEKFFWVGINTLEGCVATPRFAVAGPRGRWDVLHGGVRRAPRLELADEESHELVPAPLLRLHRPRGLA